jgi:poly(3-hydroxybutyrate) depolymerase
MTSGNDLLGLLAASGANEMAYVDPAFPARPLVLFSARPRVVTPATPVVFVLHGVGRNGGDYRDYWLDQVDEHDMLAIAPTFPVEHFPGSPWYNGGNVLAADGSLNPRQARTYAVIERLFAALVAQGVTARGGYGLFGHSAGSQFVHRAVLLGHRAHVQAAVAANAGTYMWPSLDEDFPWGLRGTGLDGAALPEMLRFRLTVMAGTADIDNTTPNFPREPAAMRQGGTRYERAHNFVAAGREAAARLGVACAWTIIDVPGVAHDGRAMTAAAAPILSAALHAAEG